MCSGRRKPVEQILNTGFGIGVDSSGNSYVTGSFPGQCHLWQHHPSSSGSFDVFIAKYDASGNVLWAQKAGGTNGQILAAA